VKKRTKKEEVSTRARMDFSYLRETTITSNARTKLGRFPKLWESTCLPDYPLTRGYCVKPGANFGAGKKVWPGARLRKASLFFVWGEIGIFLKGKGGMEFKAQEEREGAETLTSIFRVPKV